MPESAFMFSVGQLSPLRIGIVPNEGGASLVLSAAAPTGICMLPRPTAAELRTFERGRLDFALTTEGTTGFLLVRLKVKVGQPLYLEMPFHVGRESSPHANCFSCLKDQFTENVAMAFVLQDEKGIVRLMRVGPIPAKILSRLIKLIEVQLVECDYPDVQRRDVEQRYAYNRRTRNPAEAFNAIWLPN